MISYDNYDKILAGKKSSKNLNGAANPVSQFKDDNMSVKSEEARRYIINRDKMVFGSLSQRDPEYLRNKEINKS